MPDGSVTAVAFQRARGRAAVTLAAAGPASARLTHLHQSGSAKAMLPRVHGAAPEVVFLNTSGGLTGGDRLHYEVTLGAGATAVATTQTAERGYASAGGRAEVEVTLRLGARAALDWLPQETILFEGSAIARRTEADLEAGARLLMVETVILGRAAMGEDPARLGLSDWREVRRNGRPVLIEPLLLGEADLGPARSAACLGQARAFASIALVAPDAEAAVSRVRAALGDGASGVIAAASGWDGRLIVRLMAADARPLKQRLAAILDILRGRPLPRVWQI